MEYEQTATAAVNAYLLPLVDGYISGLKNSLEQRGIVAPLLIMQSIGGTLAAEGRRQRLVFIIESGLAAGVI
jgi:N-methylhydantoinase A